VAAAGGYSPLEFEEHRFDQELDADTLVARVLSTSYIAAKPADEQHDIAAQVRRLVSGFPERFALPHRTWLYWCHRA
jgi:hypothetical protein